MREEPDHWEGYYPGGPNEQRLLRRYSFSDRIRYYWSYPEVEEARKRLFSNLADRGVPQTLLSQYLPRQYERVRLGRLDCAPDDLVFDRVRDTLEDYAVACKQNKEEARV
jgi:D-tagatose-1,6-bisphosphate aldolase subunit GatZ/KbaZ